MTADSKEGDERNQTKKITVVQDEPAHVSQKPPKAMLDCSSLLEFISSSMSHQENNNPCSNTPI